MTRLEFITSDEYVTATTECIIRSGLSVKAMRKEMDEFIIKLRDELLSTLQNIPINQCIGLLKGCIMAITTCEKDIDLEGVKSVMTEVKELLEEYANLKSIKP
jgi:hypothetical protein